MNYKEAALICATLCLGGCSPVQPKDASAVLAKLPQEQMLAQITSLADHLGLEDGWYYGQESRSLKSGYAFISPALKARFAVDYHEMLHQRNQNMVRDWNSYVPYSSRVQWARQWWDEHWAKFPEETEKMKVVWMHEALLDGSELWWRCAEKLAGKEMDSVSVLAHDEEQRMVFKYAENDRSEGSLSTQLHGDANVRRP